MTPDTESPPSPNDAEAPTGASVFFVDKCSHPPVPSVLRALRALSVLSAPLVPLALRALRVPPALSVPPDPLALPALRVPLVLSAPLGLLVH